MSIGACAGRSSTCDHPELDETFTYAGAKWLTQGMDVAPVRGRRCVGEHTDEVAQGVAGTARAARRAFASAVPPEPGQPLSVHGKPFALGGVRVIDLSWMLASAGAGDSWPPWARRSSRSSTQPRSIGCAFSLGACPPGGRAERDAATGPCPPPTLDANPNRGGAFMEINAGKLGRR